MSSYAKAMFLCIALTLVGGMGATFAQDLDNARRISERWCSACHTTGSAPGKHRAPSFAAIAAKKDVTTGMIASFLRLPHATMPNFPLSRKDTEDLAALIMDMKK
jgi:mono/diheme cytochrome c family protein